MIQRAAGSFWLSYRLMLILLIFCTISVMVTPTESASEYTPLVRPRLENNSSNGNESSISDADIQKRIQEVFNRKGYSNPDPSPNDSQEEQPEVAARIDSQPTRRRKRPFRKIDETFDPKKSYVIKHPNGTITYVPPRDLDMSGTVVTGTTTTPSSTVSNVLIDKMSEANLPIDRRECTPEQPICSNVPNYPHALINQIMDRQKNRFAEVFGDDVLVEDGDRLAQRFDNDEEGNLYENICDSEVHLEYPKSGFNMDNKSIIIVNTDKYKQGVGIETCRDAQKPCKKLEELGGKSLKTECKQFFHYRTLLAMNPETNEPYKEKILLPSCCKCVIRK